jgi:hypothetical protein
MCQNENYLEFREISLNAHNLSRNFFGPYVNHIIVGWSGSFSLAIFISYPEICPPPPPKTKRNSNMKQKIFYTNLNENISS